MKNGAVKRNVATGDGVCGPTVAICGGWGVLGGDLVVGWASRGR
jgi:hypothetical protein